MGSFSLLQLHISMLTLSFPSPEDPSNPESSMYPYCHYFVKALNLSHEDYFIGTLTCILIPNFFPLTSSLLIKSETSF